METLVGREREREDLEGALARRDVRWITGVAGIGKTSLVESATQGLERLDLVGLWMEERKDGVSYLVELLGGRPRNHGNAAVGHWLYDRLPRLDGISVLIWDDFHRVDRGFANLFLQVLRKVRLPYAVFLVSREYWPVAGLFSNRIRHLALTQLSDVEAERFCREHGRTASEVPVSIRGFPLLMKIYLEEGATSLSAWAEGTLEGLAPAEGKLLERLCLARTPVQEAWALEGSRPGDLESLSRHGLWMSGGRCLKPVLDEVLDRRLEPRRREDLERDLLRHLLGVPELGGLDLNRAVDLCGKLGEPSAVLTLLERYAETALSDVHLTILQPRIDQLLVDDRLPPRLRLISFRSMTHSYEIETMLHTHDRLIASSVPEEALLARLSFLKAASKSGLRRLPEPFERYWEELMAEETLPGQVRLHLILLRAYLETNNASPESGWAERLLRHLLGTGASPELVEGYRRLFRTGDLFWELRLDEAIRSLESSTGIFRKVGEEMLVELNHRYLVILYYFTHRDRDLAAAMRTLESCSMNHNHRYEYFTLLSDIFETKLDWQRGDFDTLERKCCDVPDRPYANPHPLLPGPHVRDYFPFLFAVCRDRTLGVPPPPGHVAVFSEILERLRFVATLGLGAAVLGQNLLLHDAAAQIAPLVAGLETRHPVERIHARALARFAEIRSAPAAEGDTSALVEILEETCRNPERLTAPYYALLATRLVLLRRVRAGPLAEFLDGSTAFDAMEGFPRWILQICREALPSPEGSPFVREAADIPPAVREIVERQIWRGATSPDHRDPIRKYEDRNVAALKTLIDENWYRSLRFAETAEEIGVSASHLSRRFRQAYGISPKQYQQRKRIEQAKRMMLETDWDLTSIAYECGYFDSAQFSRIFKAATGRTPSRFRRMQTSGSSERARQAAPAGAGRMRKNTA